jgi:xylulokinase
MSLLLGIDLGTSYFKVGLFDERGALRGMGRVPVPKVTPAPDRCELGVPEFWRALRLGLAQALNQAHAQPSQISGISYSSQATTFLLLDERDDPLTPFIVWTDRRGAPLDPALAAFGQSAEFAHATGFQGLAPESAGAKWRWFQREDPARWARARRIMTISDYFTFALTGERVGDASTAAFLAVYAIGQGEPWREAMAAFGVSASQFSTPLLPGAVAGRTTSRASALLGLPAGIPFAVGALDHHVAAIGSGLERFADMSISTGTVLAALTLVTAPLPSSGCYHGRHVDGERFWRLAFDPNGAGQLEAYQQRHAPELTVEDLLARAAAAPVGAGWRGGPGPDHGTATRAILERVAATHAQLVTAVTIDSGAPQRVVATGGGARSPLWLQIDADILGVPVVTPACAERACLGAAMFAAVAAGRHPTLPAAALAMVHPDREYMPIGANVALYRELRANSNS